MSGKISGKISGGGGYIYKYRADNPRRFLLRQKPGQIPGPALCGGKKTPCTVLLSKQI